MGHGDVSRVMIRRYIFTHRLLFSPTVIFLALIEDAWKVQRGCTTTTLGEQVVGTIDIVARTHDPAVELCCNRLKSDKSTHGKSCTPARSRTRETPTTDLDLAIKPSDTVYELRHTRMMLLCMYSSLELLIVTEP
jgi:hypothetical protein